MDPLVGGILVAFPVFFQEKIDGAHRLGGLRKLAQGPTNLTRLSLCCLLFEECTRSSQNKKPRYEAGLFEWKEAWAALNEPKEVG